MKLSQYEITYLITPMLTEEQRGALCASFDEQITAAEGVIISSAPVLRKTLAYPIKHQNAGFIRALQIEVDPAKIAALQSFLKKSESVMRLTILATPPRVRMSQELIEKHGKRKGKSASNRPEKQLKKSLPDGRETPEKEVTMQDVEKGIEEALTTEVQ